MMFRKVFLMAVVALGATTVAAQTTPQEVMSDLNKAGGVYFAYPVSESVNTPPPKGYKPFYISHYGRHGSRYLISDEDYSRPRDLLRRAAEADALTPLGRQLLADIDSLYVETRDRAGDLSPLGVRQHRGIAERMYKAFPEVFKGDVRISARSTTVPRCILSMDAFCERLKELNPRLEITRESSQRYMNYLNYHSPESNAFTGRDGWWHEEYRKFEAEHTDYERLVESIFSRPEFVRRYVNGHDFMWQLYWIASGMQDVETELDFMRYFTPQELFDLWQCFNYRFYVCDSNYAGNEGMMLANAKPLVRNIVASADAAIAGDGEMVTLRFGHDGNLIPLAGALGLEGCYGKTDDSSRFYEYFADFKIAPMAGNVQMVFFRKGDDVLVKFMLNERETRIPLETDIFPFYRWEDVRKYLLE